MSKIATICAGVLLSGAAPALSQVPQPRLIAVSTDAPFAHAPSGLTLPPTMLGLPRTEIRELETPQLDVSARYRRGNAEELTVYVYRSTVGAAPVWFDRAIWAIETRGTFGTVTPFAAPVAIAPPGATGVSGLIQSWSSAGGPVKGTGVIVAAFGDWLVKLRYSSGAGDGAAVDAKLRAAFAAIGWPSATTAAPSVAPVAACANALKFKGAAKSVKPDAGAALLGAVMAGISAAGSAKEGPPAIWCRDPARVAMGGVYRANGATDTYLLALSDAGRGVWVAPDTAGQLMNTGKSGNWAVNLVLPGQTVTFPAQDRLPAPERVFEVLKGGAVSSATTWGTKPQINQGPSSLK